MNELCNWMPGRMKALRILSIAALFILVCMSTTTTAQLVVPHLIGDGMVVQRNADIPVWGWAPSGTAVTISMAGQEAATEADESGSWRATLAPLPAGGPHTLVIVAGAETREIEDVLVGDVWIASGQSNMEWTLKDATGAQAEIENATDAMIRHFKVPRSWAWDPETTLAGGEWEAASPATAGDFTAVGYFFAKELRKHVDIPIGLINTTWGGSRIEAWMSGKALGMSEEERAALKEWSQLQDKMVLERLRDRIGELPLLDQGLVDGVAHWADPALDDSDWESIAVPSLWEQAGYEGMDGVAWYRIEFQLTEEEAASNARLGLGTIDDSDITWLNGVKVGSMEQAWNQPRLYEVPSSVLKEGFNTLAIRVEDSGGGGGIFGDPDLLFLETNGTRRSLAGTWKFKPAVVEVNLDGRKHHVETLLYNKMIKPLLHIPVAGVIWYQGESNAYPDDSFAYRKHLKSMVADWRESWKNADLPFLVVQLPNYMEAHEEPTDSDWALVRESQLEILDLPKTGVAVTIDVGLADDIHPPDKKPVGFRLAQAARAVAYDEDVVYSGPIYRSSEIRNGRVYISFDHVGSGLAVKGDRLHEFAVAGPDSQFVWAEAEIEGDQVVVWHPDVTDPRAVRYAWADNPERANLYNEEGLPASPFRTDEW